MAFKDWFFEKFLEWEKQQPGKRSSFSKFAEWLSQNSYQVIVKQPSISAWKEGDYEPSEKYVTVLAEKLGDEIYDVLQIPRPNIYLQVANKYWEQLPEDFQKYVAEEAEKYGSGSERKPDDETSTGSRSAGKI